MPAWGRENLPNRVFPAGDLTLKENADRLTAFGGFNRQQTRVKRRVSKGETVCATHVTGVQPVSRKPPPTAKKQPRGHTGFRQNALALS